MALSYESVTGPIADFIVAELDANKAAVLAAIEASEGSIEAALVKRLQALPKPGGFLGVALPAIEGYVERYAAQLVNQFGPEVIFVFLDKEAHLFAATLGG